ncbi:MAG: hypothetical protein QG608_3550 [Actinomycetota bacterium]|nr:hypothetical protein [Actinomycetota bacterium]
MSFADAISTCLMTKYADFSGRARRSEYWYFWLLSAPGSYALLLITEAIHLSFIGYLVSFALFIPSLAVGVRRLHDTGRSGWWLLIVLIPLVGAIVLLVFFATDTSPAGDKYDTAPPSTAYAG